MRHSSFYDNGRSKEVLRDGVNGRVRPLLEDVVGNVLHVSVVLQLVHQRNADLEKKEKLL